MASRARSAASDGFPPTRLHATCSAAWSPGPQQQRPVQRARLYPTSGHPEYATPECDPITDLVTHDKAGERVLEGLFRRRREAAPRRGHRRRRLPVQEQHRLRGQLHGCHENHLSAGTATAPAARRRPHPVPRDPPDHLRRGQGPTDTAWRVHVSQRAEHIWEGVSSATTRSRPIINTRDEPACRRRAVPAAARDRRRLRT